MSANNQLANFIFRFELFSIAVSLIIVMAIYEIFEYYDASTFTILSISSLIINTLVLKKYGYLMDVLSKKRIVQCISIILTSLLIAALITEFDVLYAVIYVHCTLYFQIFYSLYNSLSQTLKMKNTHFISASMEVVGKLSYIGSSLFIWLFFDYLGAQTILVLSGVLLSLAIFLLNQLPETPVVTLPKSNNKPIANKNLGFRWMFSQPIIWLVSLTIFCNLIILQSNTVNSVFIYKVLEETPESLSLIGVAFGLGSLLSSLSSFYFKNEKAVIYISFIISSLMSIILAINPTLEMFVIAMTIFGISNSITRIMARSVIMKSIPHSQSATFYGLQGSLKSGMQLIALSAVTLMINYSQISLIMWSLPALLIFMPLLRLAQIKNQQNNQTLLYSKGGE